MQEVVGNIGTKLWAEKNLNLLQKYLTSNGLEINALSDALLLETKLNQNDNMGCNHPQLEPSRLIPEPGSNLSVANPAKTASRGHGSTRTHQSVAQKSQIHNESVPNEPTGRRSTSNSTTSRQAHLLTSGQKQSLASPQPSQLKDKSLHQDPHNSTSSVQAAQTQTQPASAAKKSTLPHSQNTQMAGLSSVGYPGSVAGNMHFHQQHAGHPSSQQPSTHDASFEQRVQHVQTTFQHFVNGEFEHALLALKTRFAYRAQVETAEALRCVSELLSMVQAKKKAIGM